jgi:uncharacterized membrane protein
MIQTTTNGRRAGQPAHHNRSRFQTRNAPRRGPEKLASGLGWLSVGLGLAQVFAPAGVARLIGLRPSRRTQSALLAIGLRELASGVGILTSGGRAPWLWLRVGGDVMDLALLRSVPSPRRAQSRGLAAAVGFVGGALLLDALAAQQQTRRAKAVKVQAGDAPASGLQEVTEVITINRPPEEVYRFWRSFENLPRFMAHLEAVEVHDQLRSHWKVKGPAGARIEWDAEILEDRPNQLIIWRSLGNADVKNFGAVHFAPAPGGRGTELRVNIQYDAPGGRLGASLAKLFGKEPGQQTKSDLRRLKQVLEVGEVVHSDASIHRGMHPARPDIGTPALVGYGQEVGR